MTFVLQYYSADPGCLQKKSTWNAAGEQDEATGKWRYQIVSGATNSSMQPFGSLKMPGKFYVVYFEFANASDTYTNVLTATDTSYKRRISGGLWIVGGTRNTTATNACEVNVNKTLTLLGCGVYDSRETFEKAFDLYQAGEIPTAFFSDLTLPFSRAS